MTYDGRRGRPASLHCVYFWFQYRVGRGVGVGGGVHGIGSVSIFSSGGVFRVPADRGELRGPPRRELFFPKLFFLIHNRTGNSKTCASLDAWGYRTTGRTECMDDSTRWIPRFPFYRFNLLSLPRSCHLILALPFRARSMVLC